MRVLLLAELCNPEMPSLPSVGYSLACSISRLVDTVVVTHARNRKAILERGLGDAEVVFVDNEYLARPLTRVAKAIRRGNDAAWTVGTAMRWPSYVAFEWEVWKRFRRDVRAGSFSLIHRLTPMSPTTPSPIGKWSPIPFVIGPLNGGLRWPDELEAERVREREFLSRIRPAHRLLPYYRTTYASASAILAAFKHTADDLPKSAWSRVIDFPEVGIDPASFNMRPRRGRTRLTFLYAGRLAPLKCVDVAIAAFAGSELLRRHRLCIVGDGPELPRLREQVRAAGLEDVVTFAGRKRHSEVGAVMQEADVFVFPSIKDLGAGVVVEAMACGLACVVVDYGGPGGLIDERIGVKVALGPKPALVAGFKAAMEGLAADPERLERLGEAAHERAIAEFTWDSKARRIVDVYREVLGVEEQPGPCPQGASHQ